MRLVSPFWFSGSLALPPAKEKDSATTGVLLSSTSQALMPSGVVTSLTSTASAREATSASPSASASQRSAVISSPPPA